MDPVLPEFPEWEIPKAVPVVTQIPMTSLCGEVVDREILDLKSLGVFGPVLILVIMSLRAIRKAFQKE